MGSASVETVSQLPVLPSRPVDSNKGSFGKVLIVAGSRGMSGAAILCASGALRGGAGLVTLAAPGDILPVVAVANPCYLTTPLSYDDQGRLDRGATTDILRLAQANDVVALGPGLGRSESLSAMIPQLVEQIEKPIVLDADGLNAFEHQTERLRAAKARLVLTPHPGELARLIDSSVATVQSQRQELAVRFAAENKVVLVLKGYGTLVTDGKRVYRNTTGNPGMATGGTGDVLTGLIAALLGQGLEPFAAAQLGVHLHGLAGDLAADDLGEVSLIASDLLQYLPYAFRGL